MAAPGFRDLANVQFKAREQAGSGALEVPLTPRPPWGRQKLLGTRPLTRARGRAHTQELCDLCEALVSGSGARSGGKTRAEAKRRMLKAFRKQFGGQQTAESLFSFFRLLLPQLDHERHSFKLKEAALADVLAKAFQLAKPDGGDGTSKYERLLGWKTTQQLGIGNLPAVVYNARARPRAQTRPSPAAACTLALALTRRARSDAPRRAAPSPTRRCCLAT